jgi:hypothetical protein
MPNSNHQTLEEKLADPRLIERVLQKAVRRALRIHKALKNPVVVWRDGQVVWIQPEDIPVDEPGDDDPGITPSDPPR